MKGSCSLRRLVAITGHQADHWQCLQRGTRYDNVEVEALSLLTELYAGTLVVGIQGPQTIGRQVYQHLWDRALNALKFVSIHLAYLRRPAKAETLGGGVEA